MCVFMCVNECGECFSKFREFRDELSLKCCIFLLLNLWFFLFVRSLQCKNSILACCANWFDGKKVKKRLTLFGFFLYKYFKWDFCRLQLGTSNKITKHQIHIKFTKIDGVIDDEFNEQLILESYFLVAIEHQKLILYIVSWCQAPGTTVWMCVLVSLLACSIHLHSSYYYHRFSWILH